MDDIDLEDQLDDDYIEDSSYQACYVFRSTIKPTLPLERPHKRIKRNHGIAFDLQWPRLSLAADTQTLANQRRSGFDSVLIQQQTHDHIWGSNAENTDELLSFINISATSATDTHLPTALLLTGLDKSNSEAVLNIAAEKLTHARTCVFVTLQSRQCPNLQTALKNLIKTAVIRHSDLRTYNDLLAKHRKLHPLNFDLELLQIFIQESHVRKIVVALSDVEDVEVSTVNDLINSLHLWRSQIPTVLLLGITSTRDLFEHRLSKSVLKHLSARTFDFAPPIDQASNLLRTLQTSSHEDTKHRLFLGPGMMKTLRDLNQGQGDNAQSLRANLEYLSLSHFVANPVSTLADTAIVHEDRDEIKSLADIARRTDSFKQFCASVIADSTITAGAELKTLLNDDEAALVEIKKSIEEGKTAYNSASKVIYAFSDLYQVLSRHLPKLKQSRLEIELQLYQTMDDLANCQAFDDARDGIASLSNQQLEHALNSCGPSAIKALGLQNVVNILVSQLEEELSSPLQSNGTYGVHAKSLPAKSPKGKSAKAIKSPAKSSKHEAKALYPITEEVISILKNKLQVSSLDISSLLLHEAYILSSRTIQIKQIFDVQARAAIERALLKPGDYLTCDCCSNHDHTNIDDSSDAGNITPDQDSTVRPSMPPACMLFTLLQEAPTIINVRDLFDAFSSHLNQTVNTNGMMDGAEEDNEVNLNRTMTLFYRALAELKMIGLIKASAGTQVKRRTTTGRASKASTATAIQDVDFIAKTSWAGS